MPDSSTTRRKVISPHWPRTSGRRRAVTRLRVSRDSRFWPRGESVHLRLDGRERIDAVALDGLNLRLGLGERLADGLHQRLDGRFAFLQRLPRHPVADASAVRAPTAGTPRCCFAGSRARGRRTRPAIARAARAAACSRSAPKVSSLLRRARSTSELDAQRLFAARAPHERGQAPSTQPNPRQRQPQPCRS